MKLLFTSSNLPAALLIRAVTACKWHHCAVAFGDVVYEARFNGVTKTTLEHFKSRGKYRCVDVQLSDEKSAIHFADAQLGKGYDWRGLLGFKFGRNWQSSGKWYCSELAAAVAKAGGVELVRRELLGVSPRDLWVLPLD
jgi:uncharacterized protein YycO